MNYSCRNCHSKSAISEVKRFEFCQRILSGRAAAEAKRVLLKKDDKTSLPSTIPWVTSLAHILHDISKMTWLNTQQKKEKKKKRNQRKKGKKEKIGKEIYTHICVYMYLYIYACMYMHMYVYIYMYTYMCMHMYVYV